MSDLLWGSSFLSTSGISTGTAKESDLALNVAISVINMKGGVGKTTITALLCRHFARRYRVLAIDLDPQANLSQALMGEGSYRRFLEERSPSIVEVFHGYQPPASGATPGKLDLASVVHTVTAGPDHGLRIIPSRFDFSDNLTAASRTDERALARLIADHLQDEDLIFIDCAPTESVLTYAAYHASRYVLVPVRPEFFATIGFPLLSQSLQDFKSRNRGQEIDVLGIVLNNAFYDGGNDGGPEKASAMRDIRREARQQGWHMFAEQLPLSRGFPKMMRGDHRWLGNAPHFFDDFAEEFLTTLLEKYEESRG